MERHCETLADFIGDLFLGWLLFWLLAGVAMVAGVVLWAVGYAVLWLVFMAYRLAAAAIAALWRYFLRRRAET